MKISICILCVTPHPIWLDFLNTFTHYDVYLVVDDNSVDYTQMYKDYTRLHFIQIPNEMCNNQGFANLTFLTINKKITAWDKALYYFSTIDKSYKHVWFIEDDVFFYNEQTLMDIDSKYIHSDFLGPATSYNENIDGTSHEWLWDSVILKIPPPYYKCLCCAVRMSPKLLQRIKMYATNRKTLDFLEALIPTLCKRAKLQYDMPEELEHIVYRKEHNIKTMETRNLYHPMKRIQQHADIRSMYSVRSANNIV